jgi:hypothetical protein
MLTPWVSQISVGTAHPAKPERKRRLTLPRYFPSAANRTIDVSMSHSTGATSSV